MLEAQTRLVQLKPYRPINPSNLLAHEAMMTAISQGPGGNLSGTSSRTHTKDNSDETRAETPEVMMIARARLEPVPPPTGAAIAVENMSRMTSAGRGRETAFCQCIYIINSFRNIRRGAKHNM
jgi:hypothetical protein